MFEFPTVERTAKYIDNAGSCEAGMAGVNEILQATKVKDAYYAGRIVACTACRCCMPCPNGIDAPRIIELYNDYLMYRGLPDPKAPV